MADAGKTAISTTPVGLLAVLAAAISAVSYHTTGNWPAQLGGWGVALFLLFGVALLVYGRWLSG